MNTDGRGPETGEADALMASFPKPPPVDLDVQAQRQFHRVGERLFGTAPRPFMLGSWELGEPIGAGGMGVVYPSYDPKLDRPVAIKVLQLGVGADIERKRERMLREARALAKIRHPNVVGIYEVESADAQLFFVMELFPGRTLGEWLSAAPRSWQQIVAAFLQAGEGLKAMHEVGLVHRDFKPSNVLIDGDGQVRLIDLGLARASAETGVATVEGEAEGAAGLTGEGVVVGTLDYISPEQLRGETVTGRSDQYSFFRALFEALFGARAFTGRTPRDVLEAMGAERLRFDPDPLRVPRRLRRVLRRGLAFQPECRFLDMSSALSALNGRPPRATLWVSVGAAVTAGAMALGGASSACPDPSVFAERILPSVRIERIEREAGRVGVAVENVGWHQGLAMIADNVRRWAWATARMCEAGDLLGGGVQAGCLAAHGQQLDAVLAVLETPSPELVLHARRLAHELDERLDACGRGEGASVGGESRSAGYVRTTLVRARAKELAGYLGGAELEAEAALEAARRSNDEGLVAQALLQLGRILVSGRDARARAILREARSLAVGRAALGIAADAAIFLRKFTADVLEDPTAARVDGELAEEMVTAAGSRPLRRADLLDATGILLRVEGRYEDAVRAHEEAASLYRMVLGDSSQDVLRAEVGAINAMAEREGEEPDAVLAGYEKIVHRAEIVAGPRHPWTASAYYNASTEAAELGRWDEAERWANQAWRIAALTQGEKSPGAVHAALVLGRVYHETGRPGLAEHWAALAVAGLERMSVQAGVQLSDLQPALGLLAELVLGRGDAEAAAQLFERAAAVSLANPLLGPQAYLDDVYNAASLRSDVGNWSAARDGLELALQIAPVEVVHATRGGIAVRGQLGVVYAALGDRRRAQEMLETVLREAREIPEADELAATFSDALAKLRRK